MKITINELKCKRSLSSRFKSKIKKVIKLVLLREKRKGDISVTFVPDAFIRKLNKKYRKLDRATDVLSFTMNESGLLGDIIISLDTAERNAKRYKERFDKEILRLVVHGILHLLDYDHKKKKERINFFKKQEEMINLIE